MKLHNTRFEKTAMSIRRYELYYLIHGIKKINLIFPVPNEKKKIHQNPLRVAEYNENKIAAQSFGPTTLYIRGGILDAREYAFPQL